MIRKRRLPGSRWRLAGLAALAPAVALLASLVSVSPASATTDTQLYNGYLGHIHGYGNRCVDDSNGSYAQYNPIIEWGCKSSWNQEWYYGNGSGAGYEITVSDSAEGWTNFRCLTAGGYSPGSPVFLYVCNPNQQAQQWVADPGGELRNPETGLCLNNPNYSLTGAQLIVWRCDGETNEIWLGTAPPS